MIELKHGRLALDYGHFDAYMRQPRECSGEKTPRIVVQFRLRSTKERNRAAIEAVRAKCGSPGHVWTSERYHSLGWTVAKPFELRMLGDQLLTGAQRTEHYRLPLIEAWTECIDLMPAIARLENADTYKPRLFIERRAAAAVKLAALQLIYPPGRLEDLPDLEF